jgi:hypothetical protein
MINRPNASLKAKMDRIVFVPVSTMMCVRAGTTPSCSGFTLVQFGEIMQERRRGRDRTEPDDQDVYCPL